MGWTPYPELDAVLAEITDRARAALGPAFVGAYLEGSFALGAGDPFSDADFVVVLTAWPVGAEEAVRALHRDLPARQGHWCHDIEGSYAPVADLGDPAAVGRDWLFVDHGHAEMTWDPHGNDAVHRWVLREHGITLAGPPPLTLVAPVTADALRALARALLPAEQVALPTWCPDRWSWCQRYLVMTLCRQLFTLVRGR